MNFNIAQKIRLPERARWELFLFGLATPDNMSNMDKISPTDTPHFCNACVIRYLSELINITNWKDENATQASTRINTWSEIMRRAFRRLACVYLLGRFYILLTFVRAVCDSRSGGHVLLRFLPVCFESCLNDAPRLRTLAVFQGSESGGGFRQRAGCKKDWGTLRAARAVGLLQGNNNKSCIN